MFLSQTVLFFITTWIRGRYKEVREGERRERGIQCINFSFQFVHCPYHTDVGLVTIIPRCKGVPGLHVFDHSDSIWLGTPLHSSLLRPLSFSALLPVPFIVSFLKHLLIDFERDAPDNCAVVFGGESLARLTNNFIPPCYHEVVCFQKKKKSQE